MATSVDHRFTEVIILIGSGGATDGGGYGFRGGKIVKIPSNNPEVRRLIAAAQSFNAVERAGAGAHLAELEKVAQSTLVDAAAKVSQSVGEMH